MSDRFNGTTDLSPRRIGSEERRASHRFELRNPVDARLSRFISVRIVDISLGGIQVEDVYRLSPGISFETTIFFSTGPRTVRSIARWCFVTKRRPAYPGADLVEYRTGLEFSEVSESLLTTLSRELAALSSPGVNIQFA